MRDIPTSPQTLGFYQEGACVLICEAITLRGKALIQKCYELPQTDLAYLSKIPTNVLTIAALPSSEVLIRSLDVKLQKQKEIDEVLTFQIEPLLPYPIENAVVDRLFFASHVNGTTLTIFAAKKEHLQQQIERWNENAFVPEVISCAPAALATYGNHFNPTEEPFLILYLGEAETTFALVNQGHLQAAQSFPGGVYSLEEALKKDKQVENEDIPDHLEAIDFAAIHPAETPFLVDAVESFQKDFLRIAFSLDKQIKGDASKQILICGSGACLANFPQIIAQKLQKEIVPIDAEEHPLTKDEITRYALPIGLALGGLPKAKDSLNFRQDEFAFPNPWKRFKKPLALYFSFCLLLTCCLFFFSQAYIQHKEHDLKQEYLHLLSLMNKSFEEFEKTFSKKFASVRQIHDPQHLTQSDIVERIQFLNKEIQSTPEMFPLQPNVPRVSDVLAWLAQHPNLQSTHNKESISIESFNYTFLKRPEQTKKQEKYQVKVELEFSSPTPKQAREFHDALIAPNDFVDPKGEIKWSTNRGRYRTSFILKDKTIYPSAS